MTSIPAMSTESDSDAVGRYQLKVDDFKKMINAGIFQEDDRIELIGGELITMSPIGEEHAWETRQLNHLFSRLVGDKALVDVQNPLILDEHNEPEPDIMLLRYREDFYKTVRPRPADVLLLIEVADTSLNYDKNTKIPLYAQHSIPEVWLVDLQHKTLEIYRQPSADGYRQILIPEHSERIAPEHLSEAEIDVSILW